jgi:PPM family protein phosphatase
MTSDDTSQQRRRRRHIGTQDGPAITAFDQQDRRTGQVEVTPRTGPAPERSWLRRVDDRSGEYALRHASNVVGRSSHCDVVIDDAATVSRRHCTIDWLDGAWWLTNLAAPNGTAVAGERLADGTSRRLVDGDEIRLGRHVRLRLVMPRPVRLQAAFRLNAGGHTSIGARPSNEDSLYVGAGLVAVADGVGGRAAGAKASQMCVEVLRTVDPRTPMTDIARLCNQVVRSYGHEHAAAAGLASTLDVVALVEQGGRPWLEGAHIGDGIALLLAPDGDIRVLTRPHTLAGELVSTGQLTSAETRRHPDWSRLVRAVGLHDRLNPDTWQLEVTAGYRLVLATDGLYDTIGMDELRRLLKDTRSMRPAQACRFLVSSAVAANPSADNTTVVIADVESCAPEPERTIELDPHQAAGNPPRWWTQITARYAAVQARAARPDRADDQNRLPEVSP